MTFTRQTCVAVAVAMALASMGAHARPVSKFAIEAGDTDGTVNARVWASFMAHAYPAARWYRHALQGAHVNTDEFSSFRRRLETATFVSFTYYYQHDGVEHQRVYHAMSGRSDFQRDAFIPRRGADSLPYGAFMTYTPEEVVAWDDDALFGSDVTHSPVPRDRHPDARRRDAELKIARKIELDIATDTVTPGGALYGFSSQVPCPSCDAALEVLSDTQGIDVTVTYLGPGSPSYTRFQRQRHQYVNGVHVAVNGGQMNVLRQEQAGSAGRPVAERVDCVEDEHLPTPPHPAPKE
ncbi:MAG TPA: hypothetical protein VGN46_13025 [Luteibacter sp.]|jgi:hypothetical protein|uniref:hypothetical protein n=1 Tax=Luteibacter sp. TaxID=1886636 RepID=UPI002F3FDFE6